MLLVPSVEPRPAPRLSPCPLRQEPLEGHHEVVRVRQAGIDVLSAENLAAHFEPTIESIARIYVVLLSP
jgi:hypothetical protein